MTTKIMKSAAIMALVVSAAWSTSFGFRPVLAFVVTVSAIAVLTQAVRARRTGWAIVFVVVITLLNPALTGILQRSASIWTDVACLGAFVGSLVFLKSQPVLSIASITDRTPGSESL